MTISANDVKLFESERLTQNPDGGGRQTGNEVTDGEVNNLFQDISRVDRAYGDVALVKAFLGIATQTTDIYLGAHAALVRPPADPNVSATVFSTESDTDERADARDSIESYVVAGPEATMVLLGDQLVGQRSIQVWQRLEWPLPEVGNVYVLSEESGGEITAQQYVRVRDVTADMRTFSVLQGGSVVTFERRVVRLDIGIPLRRTFPGSDPSEGDDSVAKPTLVRSTNVADAARYYGISKLVAEADDSSLELKVESPYQQLVPVTQTSTPVTDQQAGGTRPVVVSSGGEQVEITQVSQTLQRTVTIANRDYSYVFSLTPIPAAGSLVVEYRALGQWERLTEDGTGTLSGAGTGQLDYQTGSLSITLKALPDADTQIVLSWAEPSIYTDRSGSQDIEPPRIFHRTAKPVLPGSLSVSWLVGGVTKTATDDGAGNLTGDGTGRIVYSTRWKKNVAPDGTVSRSELASPVAELQLQPTAFPDANSEVTVTYDSGTEIVDTFNPNKAGDDSVTVTADTTPMEPGSVTLTWRVSHNYQDHRHFAGEKQLQNGTAALTDTGDVVYTVGDDGQGGFADLPQATINYSTGEITFHPQRGFSYTFERYAISNGFLNYTQSGGGGNYVDNDALGIVAGLQAPTQGLRRETVTRTAEGAFADASAVTVRYLEDSATGTAESEAATLPPVEFDFLPTVTDVIVPGSLSFDWLGTTYTDRAGQGILYTDGGLVAGSVDYQQGVGRLTVYEGGGAANAITVNTLVSTFSAATLDRVRFRTPGAPLQPGGLILSATRFATGDLIQATADLSGVLDGPYIKGEVDYDTGFVSVSFGQVVADSSLTAEEKQEAWYDPQDVDGNGDIWKPEPVFPNTLRFNAVIRSILPLDADLIGLDPVRLPSDGRVPIYRPGYLLLVHNPEQFTMPNPLSAEQVVSLPRGDLSSVRMLDANDNPVPGNTGAASDQWALDKAEGEVTIADAGTLDVTTYPEPWVAEHVIDDLVVAADVQIDGTIQIVGGLTHTYPANDSYVSSVIVFGDLQARVADFFVGTTWSGDWDDDSLGGPPDASFNSVTYPIEVLNQDAISEAWALRFTSSTSGEIIGQTVGVLGTFSVSGDVAPINPNTGNPYFIARGDGFGAGWDAGNVIRFRTVGANAPLWIARTVLSGATELAKDRFRLQLRGDAD